VEEMQKDPVLSRIVESAERRKVEWTRRRTEAPEKPVKPAEPVVVEEEVRVQEEPQRRGAKVPYTPTREDIEKRRVAARREAEAREFTGGASGSGTTAESREAQRRAEEAEEEVPIPTSDAVDEPRPTGVAVDDAVDEPIPTSGEVDEPRPTSTAVEEPIPTSGRTLKRQAEDDGEGEERAHAYL